MKGGTIVETRRRGQDTLAVLAVVVVLCVVAPLEAQRQTITVVYPSEFEQVEGSGWSTSPSNTPLRMQMVFGSDQFGALEHRPYLLTHFAVRPDRQVPGPVTVHRDDLQVRISTTQSGPGTLSMAFADNIGPDETIVWDGPETLHTDNIGPAEGPREFDYVTELQTPFLYDPNEGNLLVEFITYSGYTGSATPSFDMVGGIYGNALIFSRDPEAEIATTGGGGVAVTRFTFVELCNYRLAGDVNDDCQVNLEDLGILAGNWLIDCFADPNDPACGPRE